MIVGIVLFAFAMKNIVGHVGEELDSVGGLRALRRKRALPAHVLGDPHTDRTAAKAEPRPLRRRARARTRAPARDGDPGTRRAGARHRRLAGVAHVRARVVARGPRGVAIGARLVLAARSAAGKITRDNGGASFRAPNGLSDQRERLPAGAATPVGTEAPAGPFLARDYRRSNASRTPSATSTVPVTAFSARRTAGALQERARPSRRAVRTRSARRGPCR